MTKESKTHIDHNRLLFRETFNDEQSVVANGGTSTDVTFSKGVGAFNGTSSRIIYSQFLNGTGSVRIVFSGTSTFVNLDYLADLRGGGGSSYIRILTGSPFAVQAVGGGTVYVDNVQTTTISNNSKEVIVSGITLDGILTIGSYYDGTGGWIEAGIDLVEIYDYALSAEEVSNLYEGKRFHELTGQSEILNVSAQSGSIVNKFTGDVLSTDLVTNGTFDTDSDWTKGAGWSISGGTLNASAATATAYQSTILTEDKPYRIIYSITEYTSGTVRVKAGNSGSGTIRSAAGTYEETLICLSGTNLVFDGITAFTGKIDNVIVYELMPEPIITSTEVFKVGDARAMLFNKVDSEIDCGDPHDLTGDISVAVWAKPYSMGENDVGRFMDNSKFLFFLLTTNRIRLRSDGSTSASSGTDIWIPNEWAFIVVTRTSAGLTNFYGNGVLSGVADQTSGTPEAGTTNLIIGNNFAGSATFDGYMADLRVYDGILSVEEISQMYTNERRKYHG